MTDAAKKTSTPRVRQHRARTDDGRAVLRVECDLVWTEEHLIKKGWLDPRDRENRAAVGRALSEAWAELLRQDETCSETPI